MQLLARDRAALGTYGHDTGSTPTGCVQERRWAREVAWACKG